MEKRMKRRLCLTVMAALMLLVLTGCYHPASRGELIEWFQETYTDAPLVVSREWVEGRGRGGSYEAYLKDKPDLVFHLESKWVYVGEHAEYHNATDFSRVYGEYYLAEYQIERPLQYWQVVKDHWDQESFTLETVYDNPEGLEAAAAEHFGFPRLFWRSSARRRMCGTCSPSAPGLPRSAQCVAWLWCCVPVSRSWGMGPSGRRSGT